RRALPQEAERCWDIRNQAVRYGCKTSYDPGIIKAWTPDKMPEQYRQEIVSHSFFVAVGDDDLAVATGYLDLSAGSVEAIFTLPEYTGKGLAALIVDEIKKEARIHGFASITLSSTPNAQHFYEKQGFAFVRESVHFSASAQAHLRCIDMIFML
ncbi:GNAT family N-acetyltransferase, partial [Kluyvera ascorbata]|uniref:GNAT family N-acetyltransferase n=1 Tax=Kluyvera ascorbata TaxID=51288 RepID=UPI0034D69A42